MNNHRFLVHGKWCKSERKRKTSLASNMVTFYAACDRASAVKPLLFSAALPPNSEHGVKTQRKPLKWTRSLRIEIDHDTNAHVQSNNLEEFAKKLYKNTSTSTMK
jgi:hypothetical protein